VNFDLTHQLLLCSTSLEGGLLNNFSGANRLCVHLNELVTFCESTLSEELSLNILSISDFAILMLYALFNDLMLRCWVACIAPARRVKISLTTAMRTALH